MTFLQGFRWFQDPRVVWWNERSPRALARSARIEVLQEKNDRTPREERELRSLKLKHAITEQYGPAWGYAQWIRRFGFRIFLAIASLSMLVGLPLLAAHELSEVSKCRKPVLEIQGIRIPGLAFAGDPVDVVPAGTSVAAVQPGEQHFLLGSSDGFHVMYDCKGRAPVKLPVQSYSIITKGGPIVPAATIFVCTRVRDTTPTLVAGCPGLTTGLFSGHSSRRFYRADS